MFAFLQSPEDAWGQRPKIRPVNENATVPVTITRHSLPPADAEETGLTLCNPIPLPAYRLLCWISLYETQQSGGLSVADDNVPEEPEDGTPAPVSQPSGAPDVRPKPIRPGLPVLD